MKKQTATQSTSTKPWIKADGSLLSDAEIKAISQNWSAEVWEEFLTATVDKNHEQHFPILVQDSELESHSTTLWEGTSSDRMDEVAVGLRRICRDHLTPQQQHIIRGTYWENQSERKIAKSLGVVRTTVQSQKARSLVKIKKQVISEKLISGGRQKNQKEQSLPTVTSSADINSYLSNERSAKSAPSSASNNELIQHIYKQEIEKPEFVFMTGGSL
jgi:hypothetical protein